MVHADMTLPVGDRIMLEIEKAAEAASILTGLAMTENAEPDPQQSERIEDVANELLDFAEGTPRDRQG